MEFIAKAQNVHYSPYKIRPLADVIRGKNVVFALNWLSAYETRRTGCLYKVLASAVANAKNLQNLAPRDLFISELRVDQGPIYRYIKPGAQGRAMPQRKRFCHIKVVLGTTQDRKVQHGTKG